MKNSITKLGLLSLLICWLFVYEPFHDLTTDDSTAEYMAESLDSLDLEYNIGHRHLTAEGPTEIFRKEQKYEGVHPSFIIEKDSHFVPDCSNGYCKDVVSLAMSKKNLVANTLPIVFVNIGYWLTLVNAFVSMYRISEELPMQMGVICLDEEVVTALQNMGAPPGYLIPNYKNVSNAVIEGGMRGDKLGALWVMRLREIRNLIAGGFGVLLFDTDCIWQLEDPRIHLFDIKTLMSENKTDYQYSYDIVSARASFPNHVSKQWGFALCTGFTFFAPKTGALLVVEATSLLDQTLGDQYTLNDVLLTQATLNWSHSNGELFWTHYVKEDLKHKHDRSYHRAIRDKYVKTETNDFAHGYMNDSALSLKILPHSVAIRKCENVNKAWIAKAHVVHCIAQKSGDGKLAMGRKFKTWFLPDEVNMQKVIEIAHVKQSKRGVLNQTPGSKMDKSHQFFISVLEYLWSLRPSAINEVIEELEFSTGEIPSTDLEAKPARRPNRRKIRRDIH